MQGQAFQGPSRGSERISQGLKIRAGKMNKDDDEQISVTVVVEERLVRMGVWRLSLPWFLTCLSGSLLFLFIQVGVTYRGGCRCLILC